MKLTLPLGDARGRSAFTLIELLVVISIIALLAGLLLSIAGYVQEKAANERAKGEIAAMGAALENYKADNGTYPKGDGSERSTKDLLDALSPIDATLKTYFEFPAKMLDSNRPGQNAENVRASAKQIMDPFGAPYRYFFDPEKAASGENGDNTVTKSQNNGPQSFDLWSFGKKGYPANDGKPEKWIKNWD